VMSNCSETLTPTGPVQNANGTDTFNGCSGTISFTWTYSDCVPHTHTWTYTYTVGFTPAVEVGGPVPTGSTISCYLNAVPPTLPVIQDGCGNTLMPTGPVITDTNNGTCSGTIKYKYTYSTCSQTPYEWTYTYTVSCNPLQLKVWLEGAYNINGDSMVTLLNQQHMLPGQLNDIFTFDAPPGQPYTGNPYFYTGNLGTQFGDGGGMTPYPLNVVDWVLVTIRKNGILPANNIWTCAGWVLKNGDVVFPENCPLPAFTTVDQYYFMVQHRHHLGVLSPADVDMPCGTAILQWDFRSSNSYQPPFRSGQKLLEGPSVWGMYTANGEQVQSTPAINSFDRTLWKTYQAFLGYNPGDYIMDGFTDGFDETIWKINQNKTSGVVFY